MPECNLAEVPDPRGMRGRRWRMATILNTMIVGMVAGCKSLANVEELTGHLSAAARRALRLPRRLPDTTARDLLCLLDPAALNDCIRAFVTAARRRKALTHAGLPFGQVAIDGRSTKVPVDDDTEFAQGRKDSGYGVVRTNTCTLTSAPGRPCIAAIPIPPSTNEMGAFAKTLEYVLKYGRGLFQLVSGDAGVASKENAGLVVDRALHYLFRLNEFQPALLRRAEELLGQLGPEAASVKTTEQVGRRMITRRLFLTTAMSGEHGWAHLRTVALLRTTVKHLDDDDGSEVESCRYFISSLESTALTGVQWLQCIRGHWGVENNCHHTFDAFFAEDDRPWIKTCPQGTVVVMMLRRIAYNLLSLYRDVTLRSKGRSKLPWRTLAESIRVALLTACDVHVDGLRSRRGVIDPVR